MEFIAVLKSRKLLSLLFLGFASGLPLFLTSRTLQVWLTEAGVDLGVIGWLSLVRLPYTLKFLWSPFLDRFVPPFLGRRRGWLVLTQIGLMIAIACMAFQNPKQALNILAINALIIAFLSATQDIAGDAYRTDVLETAELGLGASTWILGYRVAILTTSSVALVLADYLPWSVIYLLMAVLMGVGIIAAFFAPEPIDQERSPDSLIDAIYLPFQEFFQRKGIIFGIVILAFILLFKFGDSLLGNMATPFLVDIGFSKKVIGTVQGGWGFVATTVGVVLGGAVLTKIGLNRALWVVGICQALSNLSYLGLSLVGKSETALLIVVSIENICAGMVASVFVAYLMSLCNQKFSATQFALLSSLMAAGNDILSAPAGELAKILGWSNFFASTIALSVPGMLLLFFVAPWSQRSLRQSEE
ncbi:Major Facilitator Superfamily transporter [Synechococcus sp. PCC 7502]|uniref:AmpG family muropeptide MFS transporter n=1 Tax=Synechococcus sp. PCC 7502 TaxID=1173263 RepID=UPI00029FC309|nr:AmpG family muropeptide MFS transporter [Synechococcus sp. PCC 7502]AFY74054.1 Major Facilitator Superfamily transporter [Synechococcus sp. PCC 7502]